MGTMRAAGAAQFAPLLGVLLFAACGGVGKGSGNHDTNTTPAFQVAKTHTGSFQQGQQAASYTITITNTGRGPTSGNVLVSDTPPPGETLVSMSGPGWSAIAPGVVSRSDALAPAQTWPPITVTVNVAANATSPQVNMATVASSSAPTSSAQDSTTITPAVALSALVAAVGKLTSDQQGAQYTMQITDSGGVATDGTVTLVAPPTGFTVTAMSGTGWNCTVATATCTYTASVPAGQSFPVITVTGNVTAPNGSGIGVPLTVSGGGARTLLTELGIGVFCPAGNGLTMCGTYYFAVRGFNPSGGPHALAAGVVADAFGNIEASELPGIEVNDSVTGLIRTSITSGSYLMDASGDGRGVLTLVSAAGTQTFRFALQSDIDPARVPQPIEEFDSSGVLAEGLLFGPQYAAWYAIPIPANVTLAVVMDGVDSAGKVNGLLGALQLHTAGCDGSSGSLNSVTNEPVVWNAGGTVASRSDTGSCMAHMIGAAPVAGIGSVQINLAPGAPESGMWNFDYLVIGSGVTSGAVFQAALLIGTDQLDASHPALAGFLFPAGNLSSTSLGGNCPCLHSAQGTIDGTVGGGIDASLVRFTATSGGGVAGVVDENAAGAITSSGAWPYTAFTIDDNGVGAFSGAGQPTIHFLSGGSAIWTLDESKQVRSGSFRTQSATSIASPGVPWVLGRDSPGLAGIAKSRVSASGVLTPSGKASGMLTGIVDVIGSGGSFPGAAASGSYGPLDATTGRGTGTASLTAGSNINVVVYALDSKTFLVLDAQSAIPYVRGVSLQ